MIRSGTSPVALDKRDYSAHGTFGSASIPHLPDDFTVDIRKTMWDQNAEGYPDGCTGYTQTDNLNDQDDSVYKPPFTYKKTCIMEGHQPTTGCQIRNSLNSTRIYGVQRLDEDTDQEALQHRGGKYFNVYDDGGLDWFDSVRSANYLNKIGVSAGTPWFSTFGQMNSTGILSMPTYDELQRAKNDPYSLSWHNYSIKGWKTIDEVAYLLVKSWQGDIYGDRGWAYMSREVANTIFEIRGSAAFIQARAVPEDIQSIKLSILEQILIFLYRLLGLKRLN